MSLLLIAQYGILGGLLSEIDKLEDRYTGRYEFVACVLAVIASLLMGYLIVTDISSAIIFSAILVGVVIGGKVDNLPFLLGALIIGGAILTRVMYADFLSIAPLPIALAFAALVDEYGNDRIGKIPSGLMQWFFLHRFTLKLAIFAIAYLEVIDIWHFLGFLTFDLAYEINASRM
ncbi:MAG: hypothetical protein V1835_00645 [Candidatus Micrarchaeota archaeon]